MRSTNVKQILERSKSVEEFYTGFPSRRCQRTSSRDGHGTPIPYIYQDVASVCLSTAIARVYKYPEPAHNQAFARLRRILRRLDPKRYRGISSGAAAVRFNDDSTFERVLRVVRAARI